MIRGARHDEVDCGECGKSISIRNMRQHLLSHTAEGHEQSRATGSIRYKKEVEPVRLTMNDLVPKMEIAISSNRKPRRMRELW